MKGEKIIEGIEEVTKKQPDYLTIFDIKKTLKDKDVVSSRVLAELVGHIEKQPERRKIPDEYGDGLYYEDFDTVEMINWLSTLVELVKRLKEE